jgi:Holliday junction DNA helicase RuvA
MIAFLSGRVSAKGTGHALLDVAGVGYRLSMSTSSLASLPMQGERVTVHTHLHVREDEMSLFGFADEAEKEAFELLITVSGVGPKVALATLSALDPDALAQAVTSEDVAVISSVPGIGKKTAQRIILDLADKMGATVGRGAPADAAQGTSLTQAREALLSMGFSAAEISVAMKGAPDGDVQGVLQWALRRMGGGQ